MFFKKVFVGPRYILWGSLVPSDLKLGWLLP